MIFNPAHPGEVLRDYLSTMTVAEAATRLGVTRAHLSRILNGRAGVSAAMSLRLSAALWHLARVLAEDADAVRPVAGAEGEAAKDSSFPHVSRAKELAWPEPESMTPNAIVQKLWNYCNVLRDDGLSAMETTLSS